MGEKLAQPGESAGDVLRDIAGDDVERSDKLAAAFAALAPLFSEVRILKRANFKNSYRF